MSALLHAVLRRYLYRDRRYFGDTEHAGSSGTTSTLTSAGTVDPTSTSVNCSPASVDEGGQATTCTVAVTDTASTGATIATGTVNFTASIGGSFGPSGASCTLEVAGGKGSCEVNFAPTAAGAFTVSADYLGDGTHGASQGTSYTLGSSVPQNPTSTSVSCLPSSVTEGTATVCTATVTDTATKGVSTPTGPVEFSTSLSGSFGGGGEGSCILAATATAGVASCQESFTPSAGGSFTMKASYFGDGTHTVSSNSSTPLQANAPADPTSTSVYCYPGSGSVGVSTTCTATVSDTATSGGSPPTGTVDFSTSMSGSFGSGASCTLAASTSGTGLSSVCEDTFTPSSSGSYAVTGNYLGNSSYAASAGTSATLQAGGSTTTPHDTSTSLTCSPSSGGIGGASSCTATVTDTSSTPSTPGGNVVFSGGTFASGDACTLTATGTTGKAACRDTFTPAQTGSTVLTGYYEGDSSHATSAGHTTFTATSSSHGTGTASVGHVTTSGTTATVPVKCTGTVSCRVKLTLTVMVTVRHGSRIAAGVARASTHKTLVLASKSITVPAGKTSKVKLSLNNAGKKLLKQHSLKVQLKMVVSGKTVKTMTLTFKKTKRG